MQIEFQGAARTVTGSMHLISAKGKKILLDCGLYQGRRAEANERNRNYPVDPRSVDAVILSHAHIDHSGNIPGFVKQGYGGPVYSTPATKDLCAIMLADSAYIQVRDAEYINKKNRGKGEPPVEALYTIEDAAGAMEQFATIPYDTETEIFPGISLRLSDAGHILGSASVRLTVTENGSRKIVGFTGDIGPNNLPIVRDPVFMGDVDLLISESTYGGRLHQTVEGREQRIRADIRRTADRGGKMIMPAFSVGRTQNIIFTLHKLKDGGHLPDIPVYVDSPLAVNATDIFKKHPETFDEETRKHIDMNHDPFGFNRLRYVRDVEESKSLNYLDGPALIISASGMCEAGRILHHLANNIEDSRNTIAIIGYQAEHTLGKRLIERVEEVRIFGNFYKRRAEVVKYNSFSAHADHNDLLKYIGKFDDRVLGAVFLVHGDMERASALKNGLSEQIRATIEIPVRGQKVDV